MNVEQLQQLIQMRQQEIAAYQLNIDNYSTIVAALPSECPEHLKTYRNSSAQDLVGTVSEQDIQTIADLQFRDQLQKLLITERIEQRKSQLVKMALEQKLANMG